MAPPPLRIRLLGGFDLRQGDTPLPALESARAESLLTYLLLHREAPQPRQHLAFLLWPDSTEQQARTNLRHVLHNLRKALPDLDHVLDVTQRTLQWRASTPLWLDVAAFEESLARAKRDVSDAGLPRLLEAIELYRGDLLEGCYDEWLLDERERLRHDYLQALDELAALLAARGDHAQAIAYAERLRRQDPLREEPYRLLMRLHDARGDRSRALRMYHECTAVLERELGVEPSAQTRDAYEALLPTKPTDSAQQTPRLGSPPLIGRSTEWTRLTSLWRAAERGHAQLVLVSGEPGIGKTRLLDELRAWCAQRGALTAEARSHRAEGALAYGPVVTWLRSTTLKPALERLDQARLTELARLLPELRSQFSMLGNPEPLHESEQRQRLFDAVATVIHAAGGPLLLVADDLQWSDPETLQLLHYLLRIAPDARLLVAATARREELDQLHALNDLVAGLRALDQFTEIELDRLSRAETTLLAERLTNRPVGELNAQRLWDETEGNPLFVVEALRAGWVRDATTPGRLSPRVQTVIERRLAQLSEPAHHLAGVAATIGREFTTDVLAHASDADGEALVGALDELWRRRIIREQGAEAYDFTHDRIREVAYLALNSTRRRNYHLRVARALEQLHAHDPRPVSGQLAAHFDRAGAVEQAVAWYGRAADMAQQLSAHQEAVRLLSRALDLLHTLPETPERQARELVILTALPAPLVAIEGYRSDRLTELHKRALKLAAALEVEPDPPLLRSMALAGLSHYEFETARQFGEQLHRHGEREADDVLLVQSEYVLGIAAFWKGELKTARGYFEAAVGRSRPEYRRAHFLHYGHDPESICLMRLACTLWFLGYPVAATRARDAALKLGEEIGHPYSRALTLVFAGLLALEMRDPIHLRTYTRELATGRTENDAVHIRATTEVFAGYIEALDGRVESGIARIQRILSDRETSEQAPGQEAFLLRVLLEACSMGRDARAGIAAAERVLTMGRGVRLWEAEAHRLRAEFLAALGASTAEVVAELNEALKVARRHEAKLFELRAATSLLRHHLACGNGQATAVAREALTVLIDSLPEKHDTPDMLEAGAILAHD